ncbi:MAG: 4Fe-4S binding protein [Coriobacteriales bacterium]|jgi:formate hydrogenlyase subunit 6/NADH:ubiquinone oxidoreductase subunit I|nr:4Fe-4S binding protein [Coriobacteriales bacterium]
MKQPGKVLPLALKLFVSKPATVSYPAGDKQFPDIRGKIIFDIDLCIGCMACVRDCPTGAIEITKIADKRYKAVMHLDRCVFCGQCVDVCPRDALQYTAEFELAGFDRNKMTFEM